MEIRTGRGFWLAAALAVPVVLVGCPSADEPDEEAPADSGGTPAETAASDAGPAPPDASPPVESVLSIVIGVSDAIDPAIQPLLGVISGPDPSYASSAVDLSLHLADIGMLSVKNDAYGDGRLDMELMFHCSDEAGYPAWDCDPGDAANYDFALSDWQFTRWVLGGFDPVLRIGGESKPVAVAHAFKGPQTAAQEAAWIGAAKVILTRYDEADAHPGLLATVQLWNEWPSDAQWDRSNDAFVSFWVTAYGELAQALPTAKIGGPGFSDSATRAVIAGQGGPAVELLTALHAAGVAPAWLGWQLFDSDPTVFAAATEAWEALLAGTGDYAGLPWAQTGFFDASERVFAAWGPSLLDAEGAAIGLVERDKRLNRKEGAAQLTAAWIAMQHGRIAAAHYFRAGDTESSPVADPSASGTTASQVGERGLFYGDTVGTYKRSAHAARLWARMATDFAAKLVTPRSVDGPEGARLWVLAGEASGGRRAVLVSNPSAADLSWVATFPGEEPGVPVGHIASLHQLDGIADGKKPIADGVEGDAPIPIGSGTVQLLIVMPLESQ